MNRQKFWIRLISGAEDLFLLLLCLLLFLMGGYGLYDSYLVYHQANDDSILKYKPGYEGEIPEKVIQGRMVAWLTLDGTGIDYPVMQGESNYEYLNKNPYGEYSLSGSIFLDCRNSGDFSDDYSLLYGHHMEKGYMFGALDLYRKEEFLKEHRTGKLIVGDAEREITVLAVLDTLATDEVIFSPDRASREKVLERVLEKNPEVDLKGNCRLIAFSTCKYPDTAERTVVIGKIE
ncbi:MAG: class B sortase [Lachnospiraceae bacterium]|nr:class B sortase [Lachnospiraceae bacterium]